MLLLSGWRRQLPRQKQCQDTCLSLIGPGGKCIALWVCLYKALQNVTVTTSGKARMVLARVHHSGQYLIKNCFKFGSEIVLVILVSTGGFNSSQLGWPSVHLKALRKQSPRCVRPVPFEHSERCLPGQEHSTDPYASALLRYWLLYVTWGLGQLWGCTYFDFSKHCCNFNSFKLFYFPEYTCLPAYMSVYCLVPRCSGPGVTGSCEPPVGVGNLTWVLLKRSNCSHQQRHLCSS